MADMNGIWDTIESIYAEHIPGSHTLQTSNLIACPRCGAVVARKTKEQHATC
jgi:hypothetical protein